MNHPVNPSAGDIKQHALVRSVILHLLPGACIISFYLLSAPYLIEAGFPPDLGLLLGFLFVGIPLELGYLFYLGKKKNGKFSLQGIVLYRQSIPLWQYAILFLLLFVVAFSALALLSPLNEWLANNVFWWLPAYLLPESESLYADPVWTVTLTVLILGVIIDGILNPVVEELYFRGYLLPRISRFKWTAPLISALLFTLAHFWQPFNYPLILMIQLAMVYVVYWKRNIYIAILVHCTGNLIGAVLSLKNFLEL